MNGLYALDGNSTSYNSNSKLDSGVAKNTSSSSFTQRFFAGIHLVGSYAMDILSGRFGVLGSSDLPIGINISYPLNNGVIVRGDDLSTGEDPLGVVPNSINISAIIYRTDNLDGINSATCYFYENGVLIGYSDTNSSGDCIVQYNKSTSTIGIKNIFANFTSPVGYMDISNASLQISLEKYVTTLTMGGLQSNGKYYDSDNATLSISIRKTNSSVSDLLYDPQNLSATAMNSVNGMRSISYYPGNIVRESLGLYTTSVSIVYGEGADSFVKWQVNFSDDNFVNYLGSGLHADAGICSAIFGDWSVWSTCSGGTQTRTRTDTSGCSEVESQSCTSDGGGGGGGETCSDECTLGAIQSICLSSSTLGTRTCGNYDSDSCSEWSSYSSESCGLGICSSGQCSQECTPVWQCDDWGECVNGERTRTCEDSVCDRGIFEESQSCEVCIEQYQCGSWSSCTNGEISRTCSEIACGTGKIITESQSCNVCVENWDCDWSECYEGDEFSYPYNCVDSSGCGTTNYKPSQISCDVRDQLVSEETIISSDGSVCTPDWECGSWGSCDVSYNLNDILEGRSMANGVSQRECVDRTQCADDKEELKSCKLGIPIQAIKSQWCYEDYVEIYDTQSGELVSRIKEEKVSEFSDFKRVDISFLNDGEGGLCSFCFDGVQNYDEEGVDCGGEYCGSCISIYDFFDWLFWVVVGSWSMFGFLLILIWKREEEEEKKGKGLVQKIRNEIKEEIQIGEAEEKRIEKTIEDYFHRIFSTKKQKVGKTKDVEGPKVVYVHSDKSERNMLLEHLKAKLREWKRIGYSGTAELELKIYRLEAMEKGFFSGFYSRYKARRALAKIEKEKSLRERKVIEDKEILERGRIKEKNKVKQEIKSTRRNILNNKSKEEGIFSRVLNGYKIRWNKYLKERKVRIKRRELERLEHKNRNEKVRELKRNIKVKRKEQKVVLKNLKKQIRLEKKKTLTPEVKLRIASLEAKLRKWKEEGYYGTAELEAEIRWLKKGVRKI
jgi:hypothetical protein